MNFSEVQKLRNERVKYIHDKWNVLDYARQVLGWNVLNDGDRTISLAPDSDNPTSLIVHEQTWHDFKTSYGGDVIDLCAWVHYNGDRGLAIEELSQGFTPSNTSYKENYAYYESNIANVEKRVAKWHSQLRPQDIEYLHFRRINDSTIERLKLGYSISQQRLMIPYFKNGRIVYFAGRDRSGREGVPKYTKEKLTGFNENIPWGLHTLTPKHRRLCREYNAKKLQKTGVDHEKYLIIAEGAFDAISFEQEGYKVLSPLGGCFNAKMNQFVIDLCKDSDIERVFVCFDSDKAGEGFQSRMSGLLFANKIDFVCGFLPEGVKDISDYYADKGDLDELIKSAQGGISFLARNITSKYKFEKFVLEASKFCSQLDLAVLFKEAENAGIIDSEWLKLLKAKISRGPSDVLVISQILKSHKIRYLENVGYYEYSSGVWREMSENYISKYFVSELGNFAAGSKFKSLHAYLRSQTTTTQLFNRANIFNFRNGVLKLDTGELVPHSEGFNSSIQMTYSYNPAAKCEKWKAFIADIMCNDAAKMSLVQEMAGYVLFPDLRMQKCFFLMGEGGNGKSVLINVLRKVFGEANCSSVPISNMGADFEPIRLLNSLVNFTTETDTNLKAAEARFKAIVSGDSISACYKGKDFIEFNPRAVMISACNKFVNSNDTTRGFLRRIIFINFTRIFDGKSDNKNLTQELCAELPGIFNWCYEGYKRLMKTLEFTQTSEQLEMMSDFTNIIDPIRAFFVEELSEIEDQNYSTKELYTKYSEWCKGSGHLPQSRQRFVRSLKTILKRERPESVFKHSGSETFIHVKKDS